jgi:hypothetical protein
VKADCGYYGRSRGWGLRRRSLPAVVVKGGSMKRIQKLTWLVASTAIIARRVFRAPAAA